MTDRISELEENLTRSMFSEKAFALFRAFSDEFSEETVNILTKDVDIDNADYIYLLMLGILGFRKGWDHFPDDMTARIQGVHRYEQVSNTSVVPWITGQISILENAGIPVMFTGSAAMRNAFIPDVPRYLSGYDITVPSGDYDRAAELLRNAISKSDKNDYHNRTIKDLTVINLHNGVCDKRFFDEETFWSSSSQIEYQSHKVHIPSLENQLISYLAVPSAHFLVKETQIDREYRLVSVLQMLTDKTIDFEQIVNGAKKKRSGCQLRFEMKILMPYVPAFNGLDLSLLAGDQEYGEYLESLISYRDDPSVRKEYKLISKFFTPEDKKTSFSKYVADTRKIHSLGDMGRYLKRRKARKGSKD